MAASADPEPKEPEHGSPPLDDAVADKAVDDIVRSDSDELLEAEDRAAVGASAEPTRGFWGKLKHGLAAWWNNKPARWITLLIIFGGLATLLIIPSTRYWLLNTFGVRVSATLRVADQTTGQPLKDVKVTIGQTSALTGHDGAATVTGLKLGPQPLKIEEPGFANIQKDVTLGLGSNPLGTFALKAVGVQYVLNVYDFLTSQAVQGAEASSSDAVAISDKNGKIVLTLPGSQTGDITVAVSRVGYRSEQVTIKALSKDPTTVALVTARKAIFVSRESGQYDVYSSDADGQSKKVLLAGTGSENGNIALVTSPDGSRAALVSTRDNQRDADGFLLSALTVIDIGDGSTTTVAHAEQLQLIDWAGSRLVFEQVSSDANTPVSSRYAIISYDYSNNTRLQLATSAHFNSVLSAQGSVYYAVAASPDDPSVHPALYKIGIDGTGKQTALDKEVWSTYRTDYNTLSLQTADGWFTYNLTTGATATASAPSSYVSRGYLNNGTNSQSLWSEKRDGQGVLLRYDHASGKDTVIQTQSGLGYPLGWLTDDAAIYRVVTGSETADYAVSALGGQAPHKIGNVTNTFGFSQGN